MLLVSQPRKPVSERSTLATNLRKARRRNDLTQEQVATAADVHPVTVSKWERGLFAPDEEQLAALAKLYGFAPYVLRYGDVDDPTLPMRKETPLTVSEPAPSSESVAAEAAASRVLKSHRVRTWLAEFRAALTRARATDEEIERAIGLVTSAGVLTFYSRGSVRGLSEEDAITALEAIATPIRAELKRRGRKFV